MASRLLSRIEATLANLAEFPLAGATRERLAPGLRAAFQGHYVIYHKVGDSEVIVVRVLHGARDVAAMADAGGFSDS